MVLDEIVADIASNIAAITTILAGMAILIRFAQSRWNKELAKKANSKDVEIKEKEAEMKYETLDNDLKKLDRTLENVINRLMNSKGGN